MLQRILNADEAAAYLRIRRKTIHQLVREKKLDCYQVTPRERLFTEEHLQAFLKSKAVSATKRVDKSAPKSVPSPRKGGVKPKSSGVDRAQLREEMRSW